MSRLRATVVGSDRFAAVSIATSGPSHRYGALLFVEKEGFNALFEAAKLAERFDIAILSTKGMSVTACRELVDDLCFRYQMPLLTLRDFDKSGFSIAGTLRRDTRRYTFQNRIEVIDLGLRLADVQACGLEREEVQYRESPESVREGLRKNGASEEEIGFLLTHRVELNAFASDAFVDWIITKLEEHGVRKVIPDAELLAEAYRREHQSRHLEKHFPELVERARRHVEDLEVPADLQDQVARRLRQDPTQSWDTAVAHIARDRRAET